jgi:hypothetical protein
VQTLTGESLNPEPWCAGQEKFVIKFYQLKFKDEIVRK